MKFSDAVQELGKRLENQYGHLGFKYKKSDKSLVRHSKNYTFMMAFFSFSGNSKDNIAVDVCFIINHRPYDPSPGAHQPLYLSLWEKEIFLYLGTDEKLKETYKTACEWMDKLLLPEMEKLCKSE